MVSLQWLEEEEAIWGTGDMGDRVMLDNGVRGDMGEGARGLLDELSDLV